MRLIAVLSSSYDGQRGHLFPWVPVMLGIGVGIYFSLLAEPGRIEWLSLAGAIAILLAMGWVCNDRLRPFVIAAILCLAGFMLAGLRAHSVAETKLSFRYYGPIEGRVVVIDRSQSDAVRLTLDDVVLRGLPPDRTPAHVRVALHGPQGYIAPEPGQTVILTGHLSPPGGPVEPGGYDFQRQAWFQRLGAVGYTRTPVLLLEEPGEMGASLTIYRLRMFLSARVREMLPGRAGAFAAAITTGDRSGMERDTLEALRASNLAHLLAISGLHMGLLTGFVFASVRLGLAAVPYAACHWPVRKIAAVIGLLSGIAYLALSGGNVATERAFVMVAVMFVAVLLGRRAITLRAVAVAAIIVLTLRPETLYGPGFQMSFAATTALVAVYAGLRDFSDFPRRVPRVLRFVLGVTLSSFVAGAATAPFAAAHFNQVPHYGLIANVVSVPLMGGVIMPGAVFAAILAPFGMAWIGLRLMEWPIRWILAVAETVESWPNALSFVVAPDAAVLPLLALGGLWIVIWRGWARLAGVPVVLVAFALWAGSTRPTLLISDTGGLVGLMTESGRSLSKDRGESFAAMSWLENDGDPAEQVTARERAIWQEAERVRWFDLGGARIVHATGKTAGAIVLGSCNTASLVIVNVRAEIPDGCRGFDGSRLSETGAVAIDPSEDGLRITTVRDRSGRRLWSQ